MLKIILLFFLMVNFIYAQEKAISEGISEVGTLSSIASSVEELPILPIEFKLFQNYPNPFNPETKIRYSIVSLSYVTLKIYDVTGREITTLINKDQNAGVYEVRLNMENYSSGVYFYVLEAGRHKASNKMSYLK